MRISIWCVAYCDSYWPKYQWENFTKLCPSFWSQHMQSGPASSIIKSLNYYWKRKKNKNEKYIIGPELAYPDQPHLK
jgi:hypothetical protein